MGFRFNIFCKYASSHYFLLYYIGRHIMLNCLSFYDARIDQWVQVLSEWFIIVRFPVSFSHMFLAAVDKLLHRSFISLGLKKNDSLPPCLHFLAGVCNKELSLNHLMILDMFLQEWWHKNCVFIYQCSGRSKGFWKKSESCIVMSDSW